MTSDARMPAVYLPHGGGPCFFMDWTMGPPHIAARVAQLLTNAGLANRAEPRP